MPVQVRVYKSLRLWSFYVDLEESVGTVESTKAVYDKILEIKIANPQIIVNYANFLEENKFFEDSYKVYERGIDLFGYPIAFELWNIYLLKFIARYVSFRIASYSRNVGCICRFISRMKTNLLIFFLMAMIIGWNETRAY